jgi:surfeit locus 1 family protein
MARRTLLFCALALVATAVFIRLGFWQIQRLHERQARNAIVARRQHAAPVPFGELPRDTADVRYRPTTVAGAYDYANELVLTSRTHDGAPGVELLTPVRVAGSDTAVLVDRGWVYAPDGSTVDRARWHEGDSAHVSGYVDLYTPDGDRSGSPTMARDPHVVRRASRREVSAKLPYPVAPYYVLYTADTAGSRHPVRRQPAALDEGPHKSYAFQWFSFALIAIVGAGAVVRKERASREGR